MATRDKALAWRGDITALAASADRIQLWTTHPEGQASGGWFIDLDKSALDGSVPLPGGASAALQTGDGIIVAGTDGLIYDAPLGKGAATARSARFDPAPIALAALDADRLAVLTGQIVEIVDREGKTLQELALPSAGSALATSTDGRRLVVGTAKGEIVTFGPVGDDPGAELIAGESEKLHDGPVTALVFEPEASTFLSTGTDLKLLRCHARGALEAEDRAGRNMHDDAVVAFVHHGEGDKTRLYTCARDGQIKVWTPGRKRPKSWRDGVSQPTAMTALTVRGRPHLAIAGADGAVRIFLLDAEGNVASKAIVVRDAYAEARTAFGQRDASRRQKAIDALAGYDDGSSIALLIDRAERDDDATLRVRAVEALGRSKNPRSVTPLERLLSNSRDAVRMAALVGLRARLGDADRRPLERALDSGRPNVGIAAVDALQTLASGDDQAYARLTGALDHRDADVREAALAALERHHPGDDPTAGLLGLGSQHADIRRRALIRFLQRGQIDGQRVASAIRRASEDNDADVRLAAFHVSLLARPTLAGALRFADRELHRQLHAIETLGDAAAAKKKPPKAKKIAPDAVSEADRRPLLEAMASRALSTCLGGAMGLARLGDGRAFGALLQLSRESEDAIRVDACRALAQLGDARGVGRLRMMLRDGSASVRDAAFDALTALLKKAPLDAASAGLGAPFEDVRRRALGHLIKVVKKKAPKKTDAPAARLLEEALNDSASSVRSEAFKAVLNQQLFGGKDAPLRFALRSLHAAVRRDVLNEVMGDIAKPWASTLLFELFDDPDPALRKEAFNFARKRAKGRNVAPLARGLQCRYTDLRLEATRLLAAKGKGAEAQALLVDALDDADRDVRITAIDALEAAEAHDAVVAAMGSAHTDVRVRAAEARATRGDDRALDPLLAQIATPRPEIADLRSIWASNCRLALGGLAALADPRSVDGLVPLLDSDDAPIRAAAAVALGWSVPTDAIEPLKEALRHADGPVRLAAAMALARLGDRTGAGIVFAPPPAPRRRRRGRNQVDPDAALLSSIFGAEARSDDTPRPSATEAFEAAVALDTREAVQAFLDHRDDALQRRALRVLLLQEMAERPAVPDRCLAALSSAHGRVRLVAADALVRFADADAFAAFVGGVVCDRGDRDEAWSIDAAIIADLGRVLAFGAPRLRARIVALMGTLDNDKQRAFDHGWRRFADRFADALHGLRDAERPPAEALYTADDLGRLAFGAYVGLSRLSGGYRIARIRQTALARLTTSGAPLETLVPVMIPALGDASREVRQQAFEAMRQLGYAPSALAAEALASGHRDVGVSGLELLTAEAGESGDAVLADVIAGDTSGLAGEAARLLGTRSTPAHAWTLALDGRDPEVRRAAVNHLAELADDDEAALNGLRGALSSRFAEVTFAAAGKLAYKGDASAFDPLVAALRTDRQGNAIDHIVRLGDARSAAALLDRLDDDPSGSADGDRLLRAVGSLRDASAVDRLLAHVDDKGRRRAAFDALRAIAGYDQSIRVDLDDDAELATDDGAWLAEQRPRDHQIWARVIEAVHATGDNRLLQRGLDDNTRWAPAGTVDAALAPIAAVKDDRLRNRAVSHIGWRLRHRDGPTDALKLALGHREPGTQFLAAEQLALGGHGDGISVLLTAVDMDTDFGHRERSVAALGVLGDARALDPLLRFVAEDGHALQEAAAEAIGRLASSDGAERIFELLSRLATGDGGVAQHALVGLRWFGTVDAWRLVRGRARDDDWSIRETVAELLGHHDDEDSRRALADRIVEDDDSDVVGAALRSLRRQSPAESLEPDYLLVQGHCAWLDDTVVDRLRTRGEAERLLAVLPRIHDDQDDTLRNPLVTALLARDPAPVDAASKALAEPEPRTRAVAARLLGRGGDAKTHGDALVAAADEALKTCLERRTTEDPDQLRWDDGYRALEESVRWLVWACGRLGVGGSIAVRALAQAGLRDIRLAAVEALAEVGGDDAIAALADAVAADDADVRAAAAATLAGLAPERAAALAEGALDDRPTLVPLAQNNDGAAAALRSAAGQVHAQGVALPLLIARGEVPALASVAADGALPEATRLGAIEALARIATEPAEEAIVAIARDDKEESNLRRAAWRARRRAHRTRARRDGGER